MLLILTILYLFLLTLWVQNFQLNLTSKVFVILCGCTAIGLSALELVSARLTGIGFNEAVVYHLQYGLEGAGLKDFLPLFIVCLTLLSGTMGVWVYACFRTIKTKRNISIHVTSGLFAIAIIILAQHPTFITIVRMIFPSQSARPLVDFYVIGSIDEIPMNPPNLVWIYGESLERSYFDETAFPGLMPHLKKIGKGESVLHGHQATGQHRMDNCRIGCKSMRSAACYHW